MNPRTQPSEPLRLLFEIERDDNPRLYDDLMRFKKGHRRVNRLRLLAHEGLMAEQGCRAGLAGEDRSSEPTNFAAAAMTNVAFDAAGSPED